MKHGIIYCYRMDTKLNSCGHVAGVRQLEFLKDEATNSHLIIQQAILTKIMINSYNYNSVMSSTDSMENQISRILTSNTSQQLISQIQSANSYDDRIEVELREKSDQICQLQHFLKNQIQNIHTIVQVNNQLKRQLQMVKGQLERKNEESQQIDNQLLTVVQRNKKLCEEIADLQRRNYDQQIILRQQKAKEVEDYSVQTQKTEDKTQRAQATTRSSNTSPAYPKQHQNKLLQKISILEQTIVELKLQKSQLISKMNSMQPIQSPINTEEHIEDSQPSVQIRPTDQIIQAICQNKLQEVKFKGQIVNGFKEGRGLCYYQEHIHYQGQFYQGKRHGLGTLFVFNQPIYRGFWYQGYIQGKGILFMLEGQIQTYEGQFYQGKLQGYGCMTLKSGKRIVGFWQDGKIKGNCMQSDQRGKKYTRPQLIQCY